MITLMKATQGIEIKKERTRLESLCAFLLCLEDIGYMGNMIRTSLEISLPD